MGRFYQDDMGNFSGKFWFAVQSSSALGEIGLQENSGNYVYYNVSADDYETLTTFLVKVEADNVKMPSRGSIISSDYVELWSYANNLPDNESKASKSRDLANYEIALKCWEVLDTDMDTCFTVECEL